MRNKSIALLLVLTLLGCYSTKLPKSVTRFRLTTEVDADFRLGFITEEPSFEYVGDKKPPPPSWFENYDNYAKFKFHIIEDYRPSGIKEFWDNTVYSMLIREGADSAEIVKVPSVYRDTTVTLYYPIKKKSDLKKITRCYKNGNLLLAGSFSKAKDVNGKFISELYNFHPSYLDSLTPASIYKAVKQDY
jgi:hypothetical protein